MTPEELRAAGDTAARAFVGLVDRVQAVHRAVATRAFTAAPTVPLIAPAHHTVADGVYATVRAAGSVALRTAGVVASRATATSSRPPLRDHPTGAAAVGALNGAFGERFAPPDGPLALPMTFRHDGRDLPLDHATLHRAFPLPSGRVAVLVHGLGMTDDAWTPRRDDHVSYGPFLRHELGFDVLAVRYNSGRRIATNGAELASLLEQLSAVWPGGIRDLSLIGHSMGGLVSRSACAAGLASEHRWIRELNHVVMLGSPHLGAHLERATATVAAAVGRLPEARFVADLLDLRSDGVLDLRHGSLTHDDHPPSVDPWPWGERGAPTPLLPGVHHHAVSATLGRNPEAWWAASLLGDLLVTPASARSHSPGARHLTFADDDAVVLGGTSHFDLLHDPVVARHLRRWLRPRGALPAAGDTGDGRVDGSIVPAFDLPGPEIDARPPHR